MSSNLTINIHFNKLVHTLFHTIELLLLHVLCFMCNLILTNQLFTKMKWHVNPRHVQQVL